MSVGRYAQPDYRPRPLASGSLLAQYQLGERQA
jgi:hypothetical protein